MKSLLMIPIVLACCIMTIVIGIAAYALCLLVRRPLLRFYRKRASEADFCPYEQIPARLRLYVITTEDETFFTHRGLVIKSIRLAFRHNKRVRKIVMGGSTITQQLIKNLYFRFEHNYLRKIVEALLSLHAELVLGKERIFELYLNTIYFGNGQYGVVDAARFYFDKRVDELTENQMLIITCLPNAPTAANPLKHPDVFLRVRNRKLRNLIRGRLFSSTDLQNICSYTETHLDPQLRACGPKERDFPDAIVMVNERFGLARKYPWERIK